MQRIVARKKWIQHAPRIKYHFPYIQGSSFTDPPHFGRHFKQSGYIRTKYTSITPKLQVTRATAQQTTQSSVERIQEPVVSQLSQALCTRRLPTLCHGCGAFAQTKDPSTAGYYDVKRKAVKQYLGQTTSFEAEEKAAEVLKAVDTATLAELGIDILDLTREETRVAPDDTPRYHTPPLCDRCHNLIHHHAGEPIFHPDVESLAETIWESPFKRNHIYHIIDAADFPMSLLPRVRTLEALLPLRGRNRRSGHSRWSHSKKIDLSFIITRADLLAPTQGQVYRLLPYLREVLRTRLGRRAKNVRLGNLKPVSAKQGWWTREIKEEVWKQGGANWLVGKVNVGKSMFFETIFPKGNRPNPNTKPKGKVEVRMYPTPLNEDQATISEDSATERAAKYEQQIEDEREGDLNVQKAVPEIGLLPPPHPEQVFPPMPVVSSLPGTTAQPIRRPFDKGRGELIDLPGLLRSNLDQYVEPKFRSQLILQKRIAPNATTTVKPGQSLLIGGIIRLKPREDGPIMLMVNFTPLKEHVTSNSKAEAIQAGLAKNAMIENIGNDKARASMKHAGTFKLDSDITKARAGPLTRKEVGAMKVSELPFLVLGRDILIEGVGWVEVTAQIRRKDFEKREGGDKFFEEMTKEQKKWRFPEVDVYTPAGRFISSRICMDGFIHNRPKDWGQKKPKRTRSYKGGEEKKAEERDRKSVV